MNILYCGCVLVERTCHGSLLLYRLLEGWPAEKLRILEGYSGPSDPSRRLSGVRYGALTRRRPRLQTTRFAPYFDAAIERVAPHDGWRIARAVGDWRVDAVVTIGHYNAWRAAADFAARRRLPLHLIVHDDWPRQAARDEAHGRALDRSFGAVYRQAASRLCISQQMADEYAVRYGVEGMFLPPFRARDAQPARPPERRPDRPFTIAFAGTVNTPGYAAALRDAAAALATIGGRLLMLGPLTAEQAEGIGLVGETVEIGGMIDSTILPGELAARADALFLPMSFAGADRDNMRLSFPCKFTDYTLARLPILHYGPADCSAAVWSRANGGALLGVETPDREALAGAIAALASDDALRRRLGEAAGEAGDRTFSFRAALSTFETALAGAASP